MQKETDMTLKQGSPPILLVFINNLLFRCSTGATVAFLKGVVPFSVCINNA